MGSSSSLPCARLPSTANKSINGAFDQPDCMGEIQEDNPAYQDFILFKGKNRNAPPAEEDSSKYFGYTIQGEDFYIEMDDLKKTEYPFDQDSIYQGKWNVERNEPEGKGTLKIQKGPNYFIYEGTWKNGTVTLPDGTRHQGPEWKGWEVPEGYEGDIKNGHKEGYGKMTGTYSWIFHPFKRSYVYEGQWENDQWVQGKWTLTFSDGTQDIYQGAWKNEVQDGMGTYLYHTGNIYYGTFKNGERHGPGVTLYSNGLLHIGTWENNHPAENEMLLYNPKKKKKQACDKDCKLLDPAISLSLEEQKLIKELSASLNNIAKKLRSNEGLLPAEKLQAIKEQLDFLLNPVTPITQE